MSCSLKRARGTQSVYTDEIYDDGSGTITLQSDTIINGDIFAAGTASFGSDSTTTALTMNANGREVVFINSPTPEFRPVSADNQAIDLGASAAQWKDTYTQTVVLNGTNTLAETAAIPVGAIAGYEFNSAATFLDDKYGNYTAFKPAGSAAAYTASLGGRSHVCNGGLLDITNALFPLEVSDYLTVSMWYRYPGNATGTQTQFAITNNVLGSTAQILIHHNLNDKPNWIVSDGTTTNFLTMGGATMEDGQWQHVVMICGREGMFMYRNGVYNTGNTAFTLTPREVLAQEPANNFCILAGEVASGGGYINIFTNAIDNVYLYDRRLTGAEITQLYEDGIRALNSSSAFESVALYTDDVFTRRVLVSEKLTTSDLTVTNVPRFIASSSSAQSITSGSFQKFINFGTPPLNIGFEEYAVGDLTIASFGVYLITYSVSFAESPTGDRIVYINAGSNGIGYQFIHGRNTGLGTKNFLSGSGMATLNFPDVVSLFVAQDSGGNLSCEVENFAVVRIA